MAFYYTKAIFSWLVISLTLPNARGIELLDYQTLTSRLGLFIFQEEGIPCQQKADGQTTKLLYTIFILFGHLKVALDKEYYFMMGSTLVLFKHLYLFVA